MPVGGDVEGELPAGVVEHQEVRLLGGVNPASRSCRAGSTRCSRTGVPTSRARLTVRSKTHRPHEPSPTMAISIIGRVP